MRDEWTADEVPRRYRVEHRQDESIRVLGQIAGVFEHFTALDPFIARLPPASTGMVVLIDEATEQIVARRHLAHRPHRRHGTDLDLIRKVPRRPRPAREDG